MKFRVCRFFKLNKSSSNCLCVTISPVLKLAKWFGILPLVPNKQTNRHLVHGCQFHISKCWLLLSIVFQILYVPYIFVTSSIRVYKGRDIKDIDGFGWYIMTIGYIAMEMDAILTLIVGLIQTKSIGRILERLSILPTSFYDMRKISRQLKLFLFLLLFTYLILLISILYISFWAFKETSYTFTNILVSDSWFGGLFRGFTGVFPQIQCAIVIMLTLLITSKFDHLAQSTELSLRHATPSKSAKPNFFKINIVTPTTVEWMNFGDMTGLTANHLEQLGDFYKEVCECVAELNKAVGFQSLVALTTNLYVTIYQLYRYTTAFEYFANSTGPEHLQSFLSLTNLCLKLLLYLSMGQLIKTKYREPSSVLQRSRILHLPTRLQQQIQTLLMQWSMTDSGYLSAFHVMNIGPWLLAPIVGNVITYLLIALQFDKASNPIAVNLTALIESSNTNNNI